MSKLKKHKVFMKPQCKS